MPRLARALLCLLWAIAAGACSKHAPAPDFTLRDDLGTKWTLSQQRGSTVLLSFGFTHCADTCPATLAKLTHIVGSLAPSRRRIEIAFVTVDPARDTVAVMHRFVERFPQASGSQIVGLTGAPREIARVEDEYHVWSARLRGDVAHSATIFFIDARGSLRGIRDDDDSDASLTHTLNGVLGST